tara:strand:- start:22241 stop:23257 length:1017 start_codon:yes stop_codon:yes gene_type:complete
MKTLVVDGNCILQIGFHGVKNVYNKDKHLGAVYHFITTLQKHLLLKNYDKVVVFWDGPKGNHFRKEIYPAYKENRKKRMDNEKFQSMMEQKNRISEYLEELFIRQCQFKYCEADDGIAYYCQITPKEEKTILSSDKDLIQLINKKVKQYLPRKKEYVDHNSMVKIGKESIPVSNIVLFKLLTGDKSDNIEGISYLGEKTLFDLFPELAQKEINLEFVLEKSKKLKESTTKNKKAITNILEGITKSGERGDEFYQTNRRLVDLTIPFLTKEAKEEITLISKLPLDPTDRRIENVIEMTLRDGLNKFLPQKDNDWLDFFEPFIELIKKETYNFKNKKNGK